MRTIYMRKRKPIPCEYEVMLKKNPENAEFYIDIHEFGKDFIYTETDIPIEAIRDTEDKIY